MSEPIVIQSDEEHEQAQRRIRELNAAPDSADKTRELEALAEAVLVFQLRLDETG